MFHISHLVILFLQDFCWVEKKRHDGNLNSLEMVIVLLFFMNIIVFKFQVKIFTRLQ